MDRNGLHTCPNPCGTSDAEFVHKGGWWQIKYADRWYIAAGDVQLPTVECYDLVSLHDTTLCDIPQGGAGIPLELHDIIGEYAGTTWTKWKTLGTKPTLRAMVRNGIELVSTDNLRQLSLRVAGPGHDTQCHLLFPLSDWDVFENHLVIQCNEHVFVVDLDDIKSHYQASSLSDRWGVYCGPESFKVGNAVQPYDKTLAARQWNHTSSHVGIDVRQFHYVTSHSVRNAARHASRLEIIT
jgi:hypothetical protein